MGFWNRLLGTSSADRIIDSRAAGTPLPRRWRTPDAPQMMSCDPREAAQVLLLALDTAADLGFRPVREITVDDVDFDFYGGADGFRHESLSTLWQLAEEDGTPLFPRTFVFDPEFVVCNECYAHLVWQVADAAGTRQRFSKVHSDLHFGPDFHDNPVGELHYLCDGEIVSLDVAVEGDWADPEVVQRIFEDASPEGHRWVSTGDFSVHAWVEEQYADEVTRILAAEDAAAQARIARDVERSRRYGTRG